MPAQYYPTPVGFTLHYSTLNTLSKPVATHHYWPKIQLDSCRYVWLYNSLQMTGCANGQQPFVSSSNIIVQKLHLQCVCVCVCLQSIWDYKLIVNWIIYLPGVDALAATFPFAAHCLFIYGKLYYISRPSICVFSTRNQSEYIEQQLLTFQQMISRFQSIRTTTCLCNAVRRQKVALLSFIYLSLYPSILSVLSPSAGEHDQYFSEGQFQFQAS